MSPTAGAPAGPGRIVLVVTSPRVAPGLLSWQAWEALHTAGAVFAVDLDPPWAEALADAGVVAEDVAELPVARRAGHLVELAAAGARVTWLGSADGDPGLTDALAEHLARHAVAGRPPEVELVTGAHDLPGARLLDLVVVMDALRSPGGCPWDARQTHASLLAYLLEEAHEVIEAVEAQDRAHLQEELGDLLLQVLFHARIAQEDAQAPFGIDDVAAGIVAKLVHRHPHVFAGADVSTVEEVEANWEELKAAEKGRTEPFEGIPRTLPALARAQKMLSRLERSGADVPAALASATAGDGSGAAVGSSAGDGSGAGDGTGAGDVGAALLGLVQQARGAGVDAESALRAALSRLQAAPRTL